MTQKEENIAQSRVPARSPSTPPNCGSSSAARPIREDEVRAVLLQNTELTTKDLVAIFKARLQSSEVCYSCFS